MILNFIPMVHDEIDWSDPGEVEFTAWERVDYLLDFCPPNEASDDLKQFYALGLHSGEVRNGGHGQFVDNLSTRGRPWVLEACKQGAVRIYPSDYALALSELTDWYQANTEAITSPEGFEFSVDETILRLNDAFDLADEKSNASLLRAIGKSPDEIEKSFVYSVLNQMSPSWSHLDAFRVLWLKRSGLIMPMSDKDFDQFMETFRPRVGNLPTAR